MAADYVDPYEEYLRSGRSGSKLGEYGQAPVSPLSSAGGAVSSVGNVAESVPNPYIQGAGLAVDVIGKGLGAYGAYKDAQEQKRRQDLIDSRALTNDIQDREISEEERRRRNQLESGNYAEKSLAEILGNYGAYNRSIGR